MKASEGFKQRYFDATLELARVEGKVLTDTEIGTRVSTALGGRPKCGPSTVQNWKKGIVPRDVDTIAALANVLHVDPGWLAFGELSRAPAPGTPIPSASVPDVARIAAIVDAEIPPEAKPGAKSQKEAG